MQEAIVAHVRDMPDGWRDDPRCVYIGRANRTYGLPGSMWHNPYKVDTLGRHEAVQAYARYVSRSPHLLAQIPGLVGKVLVCWCAPLACHGDLLASLANAYARGRWLPSDGLSVDPLARGPVQLVLWPDLEPPQQLTMSGFLD